MNGLRVRKLEKVGLTVTLQTTTPPETDTNKSAQCGKRPRFRVKLNLRVSVRFRVRVRVSSKYTIPPLNLTWTDPSKFGATPAASKPAICSTLPPLATFSHVRDGSLPDSPRIRV